MDNMYVWTLLAQDFSTTGAIESRDRICAPSRRRYEKERWNNVLVQSLIEVTVNDLRRRLRVVREVHTNGVRN